VQRRWSQQKGKTYRETGSMGKSQEAEQKPGRNTTHQLRAEKKSQQREKETGRDKWGRGHTEAGSETTDTSNFKINKRELNSPDTESYSDWFNHWITWFNLWTIRVMSQQQVSPDFPLRMWEGPGERFRLISWHDMKKTEIWWHLVARFWYCRRSSIKLYQLFHFTTQMRLKTWYFKRTYLLISKLKAAVQKEDSTCSGLRSVPETPLTTIIWNKGLFTKCNEKSTVTWRQYSIFIIILNNMENINNNSYNNFSHL